MFKSNKEVKNTQHTMEAPPEAFKANGSSNGATNGTANGTTNGSANGNAVAHYQYPVETSTTSRPMNESESLARDIKEGTLSGYVGNGTTLTGEATFKGMLRVDGHLTGHVTSADGTLLVGTNGQVDANIAVAVATIHGTVNGDIIAAKRIEIGRTARVVGNINTPSLVIEQGGILEGNCRMLQPREESVALAEERRVQDAVQAVSAEVMRQSDVAANETSEVAV